MNILQIRNAIHYYEQQKNITNDIYMYILVGSVWWYTYPSLTYEFVNGKDHIPYMEKNVPYHQPAYIVIEKVLSHTKTVTNSDKVRTIVLAVTLQVYSEPVPGVSNDLTHW